MQTKKYFQALVALATLLFAVSAFSNQIIGLPADTGTGNCYPFGCSYNGEYQQVYTASAFSGPITINGLEFFDTSNDSGATAMNSGIWTISLSTTTADWNTLSTSYASNIGADNTTVFSGNLSQPWVFGDTLNINLSTPFTYNPANGNLLMDVMVSGATSPGGSVYLDVNGDNTILGRNAFGEVNNGYGLVTGFSVTAVPEPDTYAMFLAGLGLFGFLARRRNLKSF